MPWVDELNRRVAYVDDAHAERVACAIYKHARREMTRDEFIAEIEQAAIERDNRRGDMIRAILK